MKNQQSNIVSIDINAVKSRMLQVRGQQVLLDRDVAALYGVETRVVNQAVKNNPDKFPAGYVVELTQEEIKVLRSKILTLETNPGKGQLKTPWLAAAPQLSLLNPVNLVNPVYKPAPRNSRKRLRSAKPKPKW